MDLSFFDAFQDGAVIVDNRSYIKHINASFSTLSGYSTKRIINRNLREIFVFAPEVLELVDKAINSRNAMPTIESEMVSHDQERKRVQIAASPCGDDMIMITVHDVSVESALQNKYKREIGEKEKYIEILNRKIFELEFMLEIVSSAAVEDSIEPYPDKSFERIIKALDIDMILILSRSGDMQTSEVSIAATYIPEGKSITVFRDVIRESVDYWKPINLEKVGTQTPSFVQERGSFHVVTAIVRGKQDQWRVFLFYFSQNKAHLATLNKSLLNSISKQVYLMIENQSLFHLAVTDEKTQIYNARFFSYRLQNEIARSKRYKHALSLLVIDIDFFKKFNDTYGHLVGDFVLGNVAKTLKSVFRVCDVVARFGGEEFVVFCPETTKEQAKIAAERARSAVEKMVLEISPGKTANVTISIGVSTLGLDGETVSDLTKSADEALYIAKKNGRNRTEVYSK
ncbi:MAG: hypothetical protein A4S09_02920 [Proteobacteria bacterium SG_bin7]|nr:MAG: hypothetical protein A4S09_02920 [Proteobacteria bacterium SG_bin7]